MSLADKTLTCIDCGSAFTFTVGEQQFYQMKGLMNEPKRCPSCRSAAKIARQNGSYPGGGFRARVAGDHARGMGAEARGLSSGRRG